MRNAICMPVIPVLVVVYRPPRGEFLVYPGNAAAEAFHLAEDDRGVHLYMCAFSCYLKAFSLCYNSAETSGELVIVSEETRGEGGLIQSLLGRTAARGPLEILPSDFLAVNKTQGGWFGETFAIPPYYLIHRGGERIIYQCYFVCSGCFVSVINTQISTIHEVVISLPM